jgi:hypothetical protein
MEYWSAFHFGFVSFDWVIQLSEKYNKFLDLLEDVVRQHIDIFDLVVQALHKYSTFHRVILLDFSSIMLEFCIIGGEVNISLFEYLQFRFGFCDMI